MSTRSKASGGLPAASLGTIFEGKTDADSNVDGETIIGKKKARQVPASSTGPPNSMPAKRKATPALENKASAVHAQIGMEAASMRTKIRRELFEYGNERYKGPEDAAKRNELIDMLIEGATSDLAFAKTKGKEE